MPYFALSKGGQLRTLCYKNNILIANNKYLFNSHFLGINKMLRNWFWGRRECDYVIAIRRLSIYAWIYPHMRTIRVTSITSWYICADCRSKGRGFGCSKTCNLLLTVRRRYICGGSSHAVMSVFILSPALLSPEYQVPITFTLTYGLIEFQNIANHNKLHVLSNTIWQDKWKRFSFSRLHTKLSNTKVASANNF